MHAVRLVACQPEQSAYEMASSRGGRHGALTDAFASVLAGLGDLVGAAGAGDARQVAEAVRANFATDESSALSVVAPSSGPRTPLAVALLALVIVRPR